MPRSYASVHKQATPDPIAAVAAFLFGVMLDPARPVGVSRAAATILVELARADRLTAADLIAHLHRRAGEGVAK